jgi:hypothetical protein
MKAIILHVEEQNDYFYSAHIDHTKEKKATVSDSTN